MKKIATYARMAMKPVLILIIFMILVGVLTYFFGGDSVFARTIQRIVPVPAATVNHVHWIKSSDVQDGLSAIRHKYESPEFAEQGIRVDFTTEDGKKRLLIRQKDVLNKLIEDRVIINLARKENIKITDAMVEDFLKRSTQTQESLDSLTEQVREEYNWSLAELSENIVKPRMYREELGKVVAQRIAPTDAMRSKIAQAKKELDDGRAFADVAKNSSEGRTAEDGGELGWFFPDQLVREVSEATFALSEEETSDVIESEIGFHIVKLHELRTDEATDEQIARISQIVVRKETFADWLSAQMAEQKVRVPLKEFYWDKETLTVEFSDPALRVYEEGVRANPQGDVSVL